MIDYIKRYLNRQSVNDYEKAVIILNIFFIGINFLIVVAAVALFSTRSKEISDLSYQLVGILFIDIIIRLYYIYMLQKDVSNIFLKEIISSIIGVDQLYLLLTLFLQIGKFLKIKEIVNIVFPCVLYILIFFSYEKFITYNPITFNSYILSFGSLILLTQYMFAAIYVYYIYDLLKPGIDAIISTIIQGQKRLNYLDKFIMGAPYSCLILFEIHYLLKIWLLFFRSPLIVFYGTLATNIFKEGGKYFAFTIIIIVIYMSNRVSIHEVQKKINSEEEEKIYPK